MKQFIDKLIERLEELPTKRIDRYKGGSFGNWEGTDYFIKQSDAIEIVNQLAEEHNNESVKTNADYIRNMTDDELAELLYGIGEFWDDGEGKKFINGVTLHDGKDDILQWLQSEAETKGE